MFWDHDEIDLLTLRYFHFNTLLNNSGMDSSLVTELGKVLEPPETPFEDGVHGMKYTMSNKVFERRRDAMLLLCNSNPKLARLFKHDKPCIDGWFCKIYLESSIECPGDFTTNLTLFCVRFKERSYKVMYRVVGSDDKIFVNKSYDEDKCAEDIVETIVKMFHKMSHVKI